MKAAICSDIPDNVWRSERALAGMSDADVLLFRGDSCARFTLAQLAEGFPRPVHVVFGSNEGEQWPLTRTARLAELERDTAGAAVVHYPHIALALAWAGLYDLVCHGHDHVLRQEQVAQTVLVNPGEMMGRFGRSTYMLYDTESGAVTVREV